VHGYLKIGVNLKKRFIPHPPQNELCADAFYASWSSSLKLHAKELVRGRSAIISNADVTFPLEFYMPRGTSEAYLP
jgi:hypothetical protein